MEIVEVVNVVPDTGRGLVDIRGVTVDDTESVEVEASAEQKPGLGSVPCLAAGNWQPVAEDEHMVSKAFGAGQSWRNIPF